MDNAPPEALNGRPDEHGVPEAPYQVQASLRFILLSLLSSLLAAFAVGRTARQVLIANPQMKLLKQQLALATSNNSDRDQMFQMKLPNPVLKHGKSIPHTTYTSKNFDTAMTATTNSRWVVTEEGKKQCANLPGGECTASSPNDTKGASGEDEEEAHLPQGQQLLIDIENVDGEFLNSEERLANAMLDLINDCGLTLLSYHCHSLTPMGVSCAGVLLESHVSFHTWPQEGVITLDLFTCGPNSLLPIVPRAQQLFSIPRKSVSGETVPEPHAVWSHKFRGFEEGEDNHKEELSDLFDYPIGQMLDFKKEIVSAQTKFQRVDVYDVSLPHANDMDRIKDPLHSEGEPYRRDHPELFEPDRIVFLDGVLQSRRTGDSAYHEALVHPSMFAHKNPKRVAIIGGGEGATLREVLKHSTVEKVIMIEIDEEVVNLCREYLPLWSDCSNLEGGTKSCFDDRRVEVYYEDAFQWFIDRFSGELKGKEEPFDVIIMDALDPQVQRDFVAALYDGGPFLRSLPDALKSPGGIFTAQLGEGPRITLPNEEYNLNANRVNFIRSLAELGFESIQDYEETHSGFSEPWQFLVAFKSYESRADWFAPASTIDLNIRKRILPTKSGVSSLMSFDGATMMTYQYPGKGSETVFCRRSNMPMGCEAGHGFDPERENLPISALEVKASSLGETAGRGVFAKVDIPRMSYVGLETLIPAVRMHPSSYAIVESMTDHFRDSGDWRQNAVWSYTSGYGHFFSLHGGTDVVVDSSFQCFINHGCKASNNVGHDLQTSEFSASLDSPPEEIARKLVGRDAIYNPAVERQVHFYSSAVPRRDISAGEELFDNYLGMTGGRSIADWREDVVGLRSQCLGGAGEVTTYERDEDYCPQEAAEECGDDENDDDEDDDENDDDDDDDDDDDNDEDE